MLDNLTRARILNEVLETLGTARACEANTPNIAPAGTPLGEWEGHPVVGVDIHHRKYRARIRVCHALTGRDERVTLLRTPYKEEAALAYRVAHVALWGDASPYAEAPIMEAIKAARK